MFLDKIEKRGVIYGDVSWSDFVKGEEPDITQSLSENTYFTCLNILANTIAALPFSIKQTTDTGEIEAKNHYLWSMLRYRPNPSMNSFECFKALILLFKHKGMAGLYIDRDKKSKIKGLYPVEITNITIDDLGLIKSPKQNKVLVDFICGDKSDSCFDKDIIILRDNAFDGIKGKASNKYINNTLVTNIRAQNYQNELFANGLTNKAVVQLVSDIKDEKELGKIQEKFSRIWSTKGRIFTVPAGYNVQALNLSLADSQFSELKLIGKKDIASAIGIPYSLIEKGYLTTEETIGYLTTTIGPILTCLEQEFDWKALGLNSIQQGHKIRANINSMLRTNPKTQQEIICEYTKNGIYSLEYSRNLLGIDSDFNNETVSLPSGQILLKDLLSGKATWQKSNGEGGE